MQSNITASPLDKGLWLWCVCACACVCMYACYKTVTVKKKT